MNNAACESNNHAIDISNLKLSFGPETLFESAELALKAGENVFLYGDSGCGKSSLLKLIVGGIRNFSGSVLCDGIEISSANLALIRQSIAYIPQNHYFAHSNVKEELLYPFKFKSNHKIHPSDDKLFKVLDSLNLKKDILAKDIDLLSGGERQRIAIARALMLERPIILADEPSSALDKENKARVLDALASTESTLLAVTHDMSLETTNLRKMMVKNKKVVEID